MQIQALGGLYNYATVGNSQKNIVEQDVDAHALPLGKDSVELSEESMIAYFRNNFMGGAAKDGIITFDEMIKWRDHNVQLTKKILNQTIKELGIDTGSSKLAISSDPHRNFSVEGDLSANDRLRLEAALDENSEFQNAYAAASSESAFIKHTQETEPFRNAYAVNPQAALAKYGYLIGKKYDFDLFYQNGDVAFGLAE